QYSITVTTGLLDRLDDAEIESVLGHELTHIRNGDVRMMVVAVIIVGVISFFAELTFRLWFYNSFSFRGERSDERRGGGAGSGSSSSPICCRSSSAWRCRARANSSPMPVPWS